jgi:hypothetical protein
VFIFIVTYAIEEFGVSNNNNNNNTHYSFYVSTKIVALAIMFIPIIMRFMCMLIMTRDC